MQQVLFLTQNFIGALTYIWILLTSFYLRAVRDRDFYEVLGVTQHAKEADIKNAFIRVSNF